MTNFLAPNTVEEAASLIADAADQARAITLCGGGSKATIGTPLQTEQTISASALTGITLYEPSELVMSAKAGTPLTQIEAKLTEHNQRLCFDPVTYQTLLGSSGTPTIGAIAAANLSGPRRITFGAARDSLIGIEMVNGKGEIIKNGGRVMKNVTGYDLTKLICGSWGTLGLLSEVTFKLQPVPEGEYTLLFEGLTDERAVDLLCRSLRSPFEVTSAAHIPAMGGAETSEASKTLIRIEGFDASLTYRSEELEDLLEEFGAPIRLQNAQSQTIWTQVANVQPLSQDPSSLIWKLSVKPTDGPIIGQWLRSTYDARLLYDWSGGLVWAAIDPSKAKDDGAAKALRTQLGSLGGHATLIKAPAEIRQAISSFHPVSSGVEKLLKAAKQSFDPKGIFNPGLMSQGKGA